MVTHSVERMIKMKKESKIGKMNDTRRNVNTIKRTNDGMKVSVNENELRRTWQ